MIKTSALEDDIVASVLEHVDTSPSFDADEVLVTMLNVVSNVIIAGYHERRWDEMSDAFAQTLSSALDARRARRIERLDDHPIRIQGLR
jgi:uncharacterized protein YejL (UPF0352 family)